LKKDIIKSFSTILWGPSEVKKFRVERKGIVKERRVCRGRVDGFNLLSWENSYFDFVRQGGKRSTINEFRGERRVW